MRWKCIILVFIVLGFAQCKPRQQSLSAVVEDITTLDFLPSGSGIVVSGDSAYVVSEDATALYSLNMPLLEYRDIPLLHYDPIILRLPKEIKPDYESAAQGKLGKETYLFAFGSGVVSPYRDSMLLVQTDDEMHQEKYSFKPIYDAIRAENSLQHGELAIEGAVIAGTHLYLLNRGKNLLFRFKMRDIERYLEKGKLPPFRSYVIDLHDTARVKGGLSGACALSENKLLFCASMEDTPNWLQDGPILGSYIGIITIRGRKAEVTGLTLLKEKNGQTLMEKVESIDLSGKYANGDLKVYATADNDDGTTQLIELRIKIGD